MRLFRCLAIVVLSGAATAAPPVVPGDVQAAARKRVDDGYTPGMVIGMVNADGRTTWSHGVRSWSDPTPPDGSTVYEIASVTKTFTAALLSQMVEAGEVALDDPVSTFLPTGTILPANGGDVITLEDLATHYSGLPTATPPPPCVLFQPNNALAGFTVQDIYDYLAGYSLTRAPGAAFEYSNLGTALLGHVLALSQGMSYEALLRERVLDPLGMADTAITLSAEQELRRAPGHGGYVQHPRFVMDELAPAGGLLSTLDDMLTYLEHNMGLVAAGPLNDALAATHVQRAANPPIGGGIGLVWWRWNLGGGVVQHGGDSIGTAAFVGFRPSTGVGAVLFSNARRHVNADIADLGLRCLGAVPNVPSTTAPANVSLAEKMGYVGRYRLGPTEIAIGLVRDELTLITNNFETTIYPRGSRRFSFYDATGTADFTFMVDGGGTGTGTTLSQFGQNFGFTRHVGPPTLIASHVCDDLWLQFYGEPLTDYRIEASDDGQDWTDVGAASLTGANFSEPINGATRLFRVVEPPG